MARFYNPLNFKAIETKYDGYRFRSRLEARWATFFNTLDIPYEYEKEGYDLEGAWYLPDFWLPEQDCFIEIKGQEPTEEEIRKARLLSLYTDKYTYIIHGNIGCPDHKNTHLIHLEAPPYIALLLPSSCKDIVISPEARIILQRLSEIDMWLGIEESPLSRFLVVSPKGADGMVVDTLEEISQIYIDCFAKLAELGPALRKCEKELFNIFNLENGDQSIIINPQSVRGHDGFEWHECLNCRAITVFRHSYALDCKCRGCDQNTLVNNSSRLLAAYEAARQARF